MGLIHVSGQKPLTGKWICLDCYQAPVIEPALPKGIEKVHLKGYGNVSVNRLKEMDRRVILKDECPEGGYYVGRRMENGKVSDRTPSY